MELKFNADARKKSIETTFKDCMKAIQNNLSQGIKETELYIDKNIAGDVRDLIDKEIKDKEFTWCIVRTGNNQYTGKVEHFTGTLVGQERYYKLKYTGA